MWRYLGYLEKCVVIWGYTEHRPHRCTHRAMEAHYSNYTVAIQLAILDKHLPLVLLSYCRAEQVWLYWCSHFVVTLLLRWKLENSQRNWKDWFEKRYIVWLFFHRSSHWCQKWEWSIWRTKSTCWSTRCGGIPRAEKWRQLQTSTPPETGTSPSEREQCSWFGPGPGWQHSRHGAKTPGNHPVKGWRNLGLTCGGPTELHMEGPPTLRASGAGGADATHVYLGAFTAMWNNSYNSRSIRPPRCPWQQWKKLRKELQLCVILSSYFILF